MTIALNNQVLTKIAAVFGINSSKYFAIISAAAKSPFFAGELNAFDVSDWKFVTGVVGGGISTDRTNKLITIDPNWNESGTHFATTLAHELGHALLPGGTSDSTFDPLQGIANARTNEGVALVAEYIVAKQLGLIGGVYGNMHSDPNNILTPGLDGFTKGIDVAGMLFGSAAANSFTDQHSGQVISAGAWNANNHPSTAPLLLYDQYSAAWIMMGDCQIDQSKVDWVHVKPDSVAFDTSLVNGVPTCMYKGKSIPMKDGTTLNISGEVSPTGTITATTFSANAKVVDQSTFNNAGFKLQDSLYDSMERKTQQFDFKIDKSYTQRDFAHDGTQTATLFGVNGHKAEFASFDALLNKTQDIFYGPNDKRTQQYDFHPDKSFVKYDFLPNGSQTAVLYGVQGQLVESDKFDINNLQTQYVLYGPNQKPTQQVDYNQDRSYTKHIFNSDSTQYAINFSAGNAKTQFSTFDANLRRTQDVFFGPNEKPIKQVDFHLDKSYTSHVFNADGSQVAALFGPNGQMTEYTAYDANLYKTQDINYNPSNGHITTQVDWNADKSYLFHNFAENGSQTVTLFGPNAKMVEFASYNSLRSMTQHIFYGDDQLKTKQFDLNADNSYTSHVFYHDGSQAAARFDTDRKISQYTFYNADNTKKQDITYNKDSTKAQQYDFQIDKSYTVHTFDPNGTQLAALYGPDHVIKESTAYNGLFMTQDISYTGGIKTKGYEFNVNGSYSAHIFDGNLENVTGFSADNKVTGYAEYQGTWLKNSTFYNFAQQPIETDRFNTSHALTGFTQFTYNANNTYTANSYDSVGHPIGQSTYTGSGGFISGAIYTHGGAGMQLSSGGGNLFASFQI